uniref:Uncharacterized protein n=1 Tax=Meloidogyne enterolobii TaxID=390850 RepID=A0A6V7WWI0_MELEN|nr:unnamed protein product [Meloidogyne enterolobii]
MSQEEGTKYFEIEGFCQYKSCLRHGYLTALNSSLKNGEKLDKGARCSFIYHYFWGFTGVKNV